MATTTNGRATAPGGRMSASERRSQLVGVAKHVFAQLGYDAASVEEIAARAGVSKPVVYEHFGGKSGIYAAVVDQEAATLLGMIMARISPGLGGREQIMGSVMAFLDYIEADEDGFRVLTRDSPATFGAGGMAGLLADVAQKCEDVLVDFFARSGIDTDRAPLYARALIGMVVHVGAWWAQVREPAKEVVAAHLTALAYVGLSRLPTDPLRLYDPRAPRLTRPRPAVP